MESFSFIDDQCTVFHTASNKAQPPHMHPISSHPTTQTPKYSKSTSSHVTMQFALSPVRHHVYVWSLTMQFILHTPPCSLVHLNSHSRRPRAIRPRMQFRQLLRFRTRSHFFISRWLASRQCPCRPIHYPLFPLHYYQITLSRTTLC